MGKDFIQGPEHITPNEEGGELDWAQLKSLQLFAGLDRKIRGPEWSAVRDWCLACGSNADGTFTHSDEGENVIHVGTDVDLHEAHHHSHLLEKELENTGRKGMRNMLCGS